MLDALLGREGWLMFYISWQGVSFVLALLYLMAHATSDDS